MANEKLLKELLSWKLKMAENLVECLPTPDREQTHHGLHTIISACHQALDEFLANQKQGESSAGITSIPVE